MEVVIDEKKLIEAIDEDFCDDCLPCGGSCRYAELVDIIGNQPKVGEWIPADEPPKTDDYILLSFENFTIPMVGRYEKFEDGSGNYYLGDCDEKDTCLANNLFVNGWQPLPGPYRPDQETSEQPKAAWKEAMMRTFLGRNT